MTSSSPPARRSRRGRPPARTREQVIAAAVAIADADGLAAVTMRRVATEVGAGAMSLYTYVPDKEHLVDLMIDEVSGELELPAVSGDWRLDLRLLARAQRAVLLRHPWLSAAVLARPAIGPNSVAQLECGLAILEDTALDGRGRLEVLALLAGFVMSQVNNEIARARAGITGQQQLREQMRQAGVLVRTGRYPRLARILAESARQPRPAPDFDDLADRMINGLVPG